MIKYYKMGWAGLDIYTILVYIPTLLWRSHVKIFLADLVHTYFKGLYTVPLNIGYVASYAYATFGNKIQIELFKDPNELLVRIRKEKPNILGLSNYTWNYRLNAFIGNTVKEELPQTVIVMGGPNIRTDAKGITTFLKENSYVDKYCMNEGELTFSSVVDALLSVSDPEQYREMLIKTALDATFSLYDGLLIGNFNYNSEKQLDYIPSPYQSGVLDKFLTKEFIPLFETNRGCPYACTFCNWGVSANDSIKKFSMARVEEDMEYVAKKGVVHSLWMLADANFGLFKRDIEIAQLLRNIYDKYTPFTGLEIWWDKSAKLHMVEIAKILRGLSHAYIAFQTFDTDVANAVKRRNISEKRLNEMSDDLYAYSGRLHTDILVGMPEETFESQLESLDKAYALGFDSIGGGEIRMLYGSEMERDDSRQKFDLQTKYRLIQEGMGYYDGRFVFELEESVRATASMSEADMFNIRILRALMYGSITIGEHNVLLKYLQHRGVKVTDFFYKLIAYGKQDPFIGKKIEWLYQKAYNEWFNSIEEAEAYFSHPENAQKQLNEPATKLNFDWISMILIDKALYRAYNVLLKKVALNEYGKVLEPQVVDEMVDLCEERNIVLYALEGEKASSIPLELSELTLNALENIGYYKPELHCLTLDADMLYVESTFEFFEELNFKPTAQEMSMFLHQYQNIHMKLKTK